MTREQVIEKVKKVLALAENNPNENEAISAALKAQKLMAEFHIQEGDLAEDITESNIESLEVVLKGKVQKWRIGLAQVIARNFRCKVYLLGDNITFHGYSEDTKVASEVFQSLYSIGNKLADKKKREIRKQYGTASGIKNTFCIGFVSGVKSELEKQSTALMVIVPTEVTEDYEEISKDFKQRKFTTKVNPNSKVYSEGVQAGKDAMQSKKLTA